jgi:hypothetical protein
MDSVDLQNGVFEEEGLKMLEQWEKQSTLMLLGDGKRSDSSESLDLNEPRKQKEKIQRPGESSGGYEGLFD